MSSFRLRHRLVSWEPGNQLGDVPQLYRVCQTRARKGDHQLRPKVGLACGESRLVEDTTSPSEGGGRLPTLECLIGSLVEIKGVGLLVWLGNCQAGYSIRISGV